LGLESSNALPAVIEHRITRRTDRALQPHFDQLLAIELVEQFFGEYARQMQPVGNSRGARFGKHSHVLEGQVAQKLFVDPGISQLLQHRWT